MKKISLIFGFGCGILLTMGMSTAQELSRAQIARVRYELSKVEQKLKQSGGTAIEFNKSDLQAFAMVKEMAERHSDNPDVIQLVAEAREFYNRAKGVRFEITPEMTSYRQRQSALKKEIGKLADEAWASYVSELKAKGSLIEKNFPVPLPPDADMDEILNRHVILSEIDWESALFVQLGLNWIPAGSPTQGFYFVEGSCREFNMLFEAIQRYRSSVQNQIGTKWNVAGEIVDATMLAPDGTKDRAGTPYSGWRVRPRAIHVPGLLTVFLGDSTDLDASFIGESDLSTLRNFSITSIPDDIDPAELVRIYVVALKEKNWDLHLECIDPSLRFHAGQLDSLRYNWEVQQKGLENFHCHAEPTSLSEIETTKGFVNDDLENFFGDGVERIPASEIEERVVVTVSLFDEKGLQTVRPRNITVERKGGRRWYLTSGMTLTF